MSNNLSTLEEFDLERQLRTPHLLYSRNDQAAKKKIAYVVLAKTEDEILLVNSTGFEDHAVLAGLSEKHIEYFAKYAPREYRESLMDTISGEFAVSEILEIAKSMDEDLSKESTQNQRRVRNVFRYIRDNQTVFQF